jgi:erythromycin esterase-like protein
MSAKSLSHEAAIVRTAAQAIEAPCDYDSLVAMAAKAKLVLLGEASHGTEEFYATRAALTRRLIEEGGFRAVIVEGDWPDTFRVHRYVTGRGDDASAATALSDFRRFPSWMWRNTVVVEFLEWLRGWNQGVLQPQERAGFYGMDLYSMHASIDSVLTYLDEKDPHAATRARQRYGCFEHFSEEPQDYAHETVIRGKEPCEDQVIEQLVDLRRKHAELIRQDGHLAEEDYFSAEQNARLVMNAERYYRAMYHGREQSWNLRDTHMFETLQELLAHIEGGAGKIVVWAHNSHLGDARATSMTRRGEINVGQLVRQCYGKNSFHIGFTTYTGTVTAASDWGSAMECKRVRPGMTDSYEELFHAVGIPNFWLNLRAKNEAAGLLRQERLERAIGVIYLPQTERMSHYFYARLADQFDAVIHLDETRALEPLERSFRWDREELAETYPTGL